MRHNLTTIWHMSASLLCFWVCLHAFNLACVLTSKSSTAYLTANRFLVFPPGVAKFIWKWNQIINPIIAKNLCCRKIQVDLFSFKYWWWWREIKLCFTDGQDITHAISSQQLASPHPYTKEYKESIKGQGPTDPAVAYPEHDLHKKATNLASSVSFMSRMFAVSHVKLNELIDFYHG